MSAPIFISHASEDREFAEQITSYLEQRGIKCFIAPRDIRPGAEYAEQIIDGLDAAGAIVFLLSENSNKSIFVRKEIERSVSKGKNVFTVRIREVTPARALELFVSSEQWIDAWRPPITQYLDRLAVGISATMNLPLQPPPEADRTVFAPRTVVPTSQPPVPPPPVAAAPPTAAPPTASPVVPPPPPVTAPPPVAKPASPPPPAADAYRIGPAADTPLRADAPPPVRDKPAAEKPAPVKPAADGERKRGSNGVLVAGGLVGLAGVAGALTYFVVLPMLEDKPVVETPGTVVAAGPEVTPASPPPPASPPASPPPPSSWTSPPPPPASPPASPPPPPVSPPPPPVSPPPPPVSPGVPAPTVPADARAAYERYFALADAGNGAAIYDELLDSALKETISRQSVIDVFNARTGQFGRGGGSRVVTTVARLSEPPFQSGTYGPYLYIRAETTTARGVVADGIFLRQQDDGRYALADVEYAEAARALTAAERDQVVGVATRLFQGLENGTVDKGVMASPAPDTTDWFDQVQSMRGGDLSARTIATVFTMTEVDGTRGDYAYVQFDAVFTDARVTEQAWLKRDSGGGWKVIKFWAQPDQ
jgi:hypothetical protein